METHHGNRQCSGHHTGDNFVDFVGMNSQSIKGVDSGEFRMGFGAQVRWVTSAFVSQQGVQTRVF